MPFRAVELSLNPITPPPPFVPPLLNTMPFTWVKAEVETLVTVDNAKVAVSAAALGTVVGSKFAAVFQSAL